MPQISLYIGETTLKKVEPHYPAGFEDLFGSINDPTFERPDSPGFGSDSPREEF